MGWKKLSTSFKTITRSTTTFLLYTKQEKKVHCRNSSTYVPGVCSTWRHGHLGHQEGVIRNKEKSIPNYISNSLFIRVHSQLVVSTMNILQTFINHKLYEIAGQAVILNILWISRPVFQTIFIVSIQKILYWVWYSFSVTIMHEVFLCQ